MEPPTTPGPDDTSPRLLRRRRPAGLGRDAWILGVALLFVGCAVFVRPAWRALDPELALALSGNESLAQLGVAIDLWGAPVVSPMDGGVFLSPQPHSPFQKVTTPAKEQASPKQALMHLAQVCEHFASSRAEPHGAEARRLADAARVARSNAERALGLVDFPRKGPYPYRYASNPGASYYLTQLEPYSMGPNQRDELGFGDDLRFRGVHFDMVDRLNLYEHWSQLVPALVASVLLAALLLSFVPPITRLASREVAVALILGALSAWGSNAVLTEWGGWNPSWETLKEGLGLSATPLPIKVGRARGGIALFLGLCAALTSLLVRLPQLPAQDGALARGDAEREVARLERAFGYSDLRVADALESLAHRPAASSSRSTAAPRCSCPTPTRRSSRAITPTREVASKTWGGSQP